MQSDMIDFGKVIVLNSTNVSQWPITSEITHLGLHTTELIAEHTKEGKWPAVPFEDTTQEATLWIFLNINGAWYGSGVERLRPGQVAKPECQPSGYAGAWYYDRHRWQVMTGYQPKPGELVGFAVVAGDTRGFGQIAVQERTAIVLVPFPTDAGADYPPWASGGPAPAPVPVPAPNPVPPAVDERGLQLRLLLRLLDELHQAVDGIAALNTRLDTLQKNGITVHL